jgi:hypothetical protein
MSDEDLGTAITSAETRLASDLDNTATYELLVNLVNEWNRRVPVTATPDAEASDTPPAPAPADDTIPN